MKKIISLILAVVMVTCLFAACGNNEDYSANATYDPTIKVGDTGGLKLPLTKEPMKIIPLKEKMEKLELDYIRSVLTECGHNVQKTADELGVHRSLIYRKLQGKQE